MSTVDIASAESFIEALDLPEPSRDLAPSEAREASQPFAEEKDQVAVVAAAILSFPKDTPVEIRDAVSNWTLLAQLAASKAVPDRETNMSEWLSVYKETLEKTGWSVLEYSVTENVEGVYGFTVHQKILDVVAAVLAPVPAALKIIVATLEALQNMNKESPFITLFDRRSKSSQSAGFTVANCETDAGSAALRGLEFEVEARQTMTQVLFFKFTQQEARLARRTVHYQLSAQAIKRLAPKVADKVLGQAEDNILATEI